MTDDYGYEPARRQTDHDRVVTSGAWTGAILGMALVGWLDMHLPGLLAWALEWAVILGACYAMAAWKRAWYAWAAFWGMAALCPLAGILRLAGALDSAWSATAWWLACVMVFLWYWLVRIPRLQPAVQAVARTEIHVFHHVIHHGAGLPSADVTQIPGWSAPSVTASARPAIQGPARKALAAVRRDRTDRKRKQDRRRSPR